MSFFLIVLGVCSLIFSIAFMLLVKVTKDNNTIDILYANDSLGKDIRNKMEKVKSILSIIFLVMGIILIAVGLLS